MYIFGLGSRAGHSGGIIEIIYPVTVLWVGALILLWLGVVVIRHTSKNNVSKKECWYVSGILLVTFSLVGYLSLLKPIYLEPIAIIKDAQKEAVKEGYVITPELNEKDLETLVGNWGDTTIFKVGNSYYMKGLDSVSVEQASLDIQNLTGNFYKYSKLSLTSYGGIKVATGSGTTYLLITDKGPLYANMHGTSLTGEREFWFTLLSAPSPSY